jgi:hypothetical protein
VITVVGSTSTERGSKSSFVSSAAIEHDTVVEPNRRGKVPMRKAPRRGRKVKDVIRNRMDKPYSVMRNKTSYMRKRQEATRSMPPSGFVRKVRDAPVVSGGHERHAPAAYERYLKDVRVAMECTTRDREHLRELHTGVVLHARKHVNVVDSWREVYRETVDITKEQKPQKIYNRQDIDVQIISVDGVHVAFYYPKSRIVDWSAIQAWVNRHFTPDTTRYTYGTFDTMIRDLCRNHRTKIGQDATRRDRDTFDVVTSYHESRFRMDRRSDSPRREHKSRSISRSRSEVTPVSTSHNYGRRITIVQRKRERSRSRSPDRSHKTERGRRMSRSPSTSRSPSRSKSRSTSTSRSRSRSRSRSSSESPAASSEIIETTNQSNTSPLNTPLRDNESEELLTAVPNESDTWNASDYAIDFNNDDEIVIEVEESELDVVTEPTTNRNDNELAAIVPTYEEPLCGEDEDDVVIIVEEEEGEEEEIIIEIDADDDDDDSAK